MSTAYDLPIDLSIKRRTERPADQSNIHDKRASFQRYTSKTVDHSLIHHQHDHHLDPFDLLHQLAVRGNWPDIRLHDQRHLLASKLSGHPLASTGWLRQPDRTSAGRSRVNSDSSSDNNTDEQQVRAPCSRHRPADVLPDSHELAPSAHQDKRRSSRPLTGKHVRQGAGASAQTLSTLRNVLRQRRQSAETSS